MNQKNTAKDTKMTKMIIVAILILSIGGGVMLIYLSSIEESSVFNIPYNSESAWKNAQFHSMLLFRTLLLPDSMYQTTELDLAEEFSILNDGLTYRVTIKEGIVWSNGEPLTIEDVVFSIESSLKAKDTNGIYTLAFSKIVGYEDFIDNVTDHLIGLEVSGQTVTIQLTSLYPSMEQILAQFVIVPKHILEQEEVTMLNYNEFWENPVVSGMYKVEEVTEEVVTLVKNERYIGEEPLIETIKMHTNYQQELLDYFSTNNISDITNYRIKVGVEEYLTSSLFYRYFIFNMQGIDGNENEAMQDVRVRKAIAYAINRENIIEHIYENTTTIINSGIPDSHYAVSRDSIEYDPEMAKQLLEEAGYDFERPLVLAYYYADNVSESFMYAVANDL
ncbi:MAG: ABC transporter substrate-binding protein, partial [Eubacteriales bacterium]